MARTKKVPFAPWESKNASGIEKRYIRLGDTLLCSAAARGLSPSAFKALIYMKIEAAGKKNFQFPCHKYIDFMSKPTFYKAIKELEEVGFIDIISRNKNLRIPNEYAFSSRWQNYKRP